MPGRLSYDPSVQGLLQATLPPGSSVLGDEEGLRRRVTWPLIMRASGLGQIQGGEVVLVPAERVPRVLPALPDLAVSGIAALVFASDTISPEVQGFPAITLAAVPRSSDIRLLQESMEQFVMRRRRELFERTQELHRELVEAAIGGAGVDDLLAVAARAGRQALLDQEGEIVAGGDGMEVNGALLVRARIGVHGVTDGVVRLDEPPALVAPVMAGKERRGIVVVTGINGADLDEDEVLVSTLASAVAISLSRLPGSSIPTVEMLLTSGTSGPVNSLMRQEGTDWQVLALRDQEISLARIGRAADAEFSARRLQHLLARQNDALVVLVAETGSRDWDSIVTALMRRLGVSNLLAGVSLQHTGPEGISQAVQEAVLAMHHSDGVTITRYDAIEVDVLLERIPEWQTFVQNRLGPLLQEGPNRRDLLQTLSVYLTTGRNVSEAARQLQVHRNTLLYRLQRIRQLLGQDLEEANALFALDLALRILRVRGDLLTATGDSD